MFLLGQAFVCSDEPNRLTVDEQKDGWTLIFDGQTTLGWRGYKMDKMPGGWSVENGALVRAFGGAGGKGAGGGDDIVTTEEYENFDLSLEWKVKSNGNSGVLFHVSEEPETSWHYAPEVQILDNLTHPNRDKRQLAGSCYDLYAPAKDATKPPGQWNQMRVLVNGPHVEHWINGEKMVEYELWSDDWNQKVVNSKHKEHPKFGTFKKGPICLQDHSDRVEFRNIKLKVLPIIADRTTGGTGALAPTEDRVNFPKDYAKSFEVLRTVEREEGAKLVTVYGNASAASINKLEQLPYPYGSILVMETSDTVKDVNGKPLRAASGALKKDSVLGLHVMRRERNFGKAYADKRSGEWEFVEYRADGSFITPPQKSASCAECHIKAGSERDFVYNGRFPK